jgi:hypothetical protein
MGFLEYYMRFIEGFSKIAHPFTSKEGYEVSMDIGL